MKLTVLVDNNTFLDQIFISEAGLSYFIEVDGKKILFDVGYSDAFLKNAQKLDIDLRQIDFVVLSHGHFDHTWGLPFLAKFLSESKSAKKPILITNPAAFASRRIKKTKEIGANMSAESLSNSFKLNLCAEPVQITKNLLYLGEIPRENEFESKKPLGNVIANKRKTPDFIKDDSAMVYRSKAGLVIITGCSHSGICNIVAYARKIMKDDRILDIVGGFHLLKPSASQLSGTLDYMKKLNPKAIHACHCTDLRSKIALAGVANLDEIGSGVVLRYS